jgi:tRNA-modifying protein YgfZ
MTPSAEFLAQHAALTEGAAVAALLGRTLLEIRGCDRVSFLHAFCTNNIKALAVGQGCEAFITSPQGKTLGYVLVFCESDRLLLDTSPGQAAVLIAHFERYVLTEDVQFVERTAESALLLVAGRNSDAVLRSALRAEPPAEMLACGAATIDGVTVQLARVPYANSGYFLRHPSAETARLQSALQSAGAALCGQDALEAARLEAGFPLFGIDITEENLPQEVGRDAQAISFTKGCYLGQETVARIDALGHVNRKLVGLKFSGSELPPADMPLLAGNKEVGRVTSSAWSPALNGPLALGYVRTQHARPGSRLESAFGAAEVIKLPVTGSLPVG